MNREDYFHVLWEKKKIKTKPNHHQQQTKPNQTNPKQNKTKLFLALASQ